MWSLTGAFREMNLYNKGIDSANEQWLALSVSPCAVNEVLTKDHMRPGVSWTHAVSEIGHIYLLAVQSSAFRSQKAILYPRISSQVFPKTHDRDLWVMLLRSWQSSTGLFSLRERTERAHRQDPDISRTYHSEWPQEVSQSIGTNQFPFF